jgi:transposase
LQLIRAKPFHPCLTILPYRELRIPSKPNRKTRRIYDAELCKERISIESFFNNLKQFMRIATRFEKLLANFMDARSP